MEELEEEEPDEEEQVIDEPVEEEQVIDEPIEEEQVIEEPTKEEPTEQQSVDQESAEEEPVDLIYEDEYEWKTDAAEEEEPDERRGEIQYYTKDELKHSGNKK